MKKLETILTHALEAVVALCFLAIFVIVVTLVVLRYAFNSSITFGDLNDPDHRVSELSKSPYAFRLLERLG